MNTLNNEIKIERDVGVQPTQLAADQAETTAAPAAPEKQLKYTDEVIIRGSTWAAIWHMAWPLFLNMVTSP